MTEEPRKEDTLLHLMLMEKELLLGPCRSETTLVTVTINGGVWDAERREKSFKLLQAQEQTTPMYTKSSKRWQEACMDEQGAPD